MTVSAGGSGNDGIPTMSIFSYAQAAKGKPTQSSTPTSNKSSMSLPPLPKENISTASTVSNDAAKMSWADDSTDVSTAVDDVPSHSTSNGVDTELYEPSPNNRPQPAEQPQRKDSHPSSPELPASSYSTLAKDDDLALNTNAPPESHSDNKSQSSAVEDTPLEASEDTGRQGKRDGRKGKIDSTPLKEAAPPAINFWAQRAQEAKAKHVVGHTPPKAVTPSNNAMSISQREKEGVATTPNRDKHNKSRELKTAYDQRSLQTFNHSSPKKSDLASRNRNESTTDQTSELNSNQDSRNRNEARSNGPKATRAAQHDAPPPVRSTLPSVRDEVSWPTFENTKDEERRKAQEKEGKADKDRAAGPTSKPHGKSEWVVVPYTPSVKFNTPLPIIGKRGGRGASRGVRDAGARGSSSAGVTSETVGNANVTAATVDPQSDFGRRGRADSNDVRSTSQIPRSKRPSSEGKVTIRDQRPVGGAQGKRPSLQEGSTANQTNSNETNVAEKASRVGPERSSSRKDATYAVLEKTGENEVPSTKATEISTELAGNQRRSFATQTDSTLDVVPGFKQKWRSSHVLQNGDAGFGAGENKKRHSADEGSAGGKPSWSERKSEGSSRPYDYYRDPTNFLPHRERGDGRPDRGRGVRGGRGLPYHIQAHHYANQHLPGSGPMSSSPITLLNSSRSSAFPPQYSPQPGQFPSSTRGYRAGPRSASIPNDSTYGRLATGYLNGTHLAMQSQTNNVYDYAGMQSVSPYTYGPYLEQLTAINAAAAQIQYYFSLENMLKDMFLRKHMDSQGFVSVSLVADFKRIKDLGADAEMIKFICQQSPEYELRVGMDGKERFRKREGWEQWILSIEERDPSARNDGPPQTDYSLPALYSYMPTNPSIGRSPISPTELVPHPTDAVFPSFNGLPISFPSPVPVASPVNGYTNLNPPSNRHSLSTAESELGYRLPQATASAMNGTASNTHEDTDSFPDDRVEQLTVMVRPRDMNSARPPYTTEASRTFSNGSIDSRSIFEELNKCDERQPRSLSRTNGILESDRNNTLSEPRRTGLSRSPLGRTPADSVDVYWIKQRETLEPISVETTNKPYPELYIHLHAKALQQRQTASPGDCPYDMDVLYQFWSHFLIRNFNTRLYDEFKRLAHEDASQQSFVGMMNLTKYYSESLSSQSTIRDCIAQHYVQLVKAEDASKDRPAFKQLRAAWRNGALNMKNRKKISDFVDAELRTELER